MPISILDGFRKLDKPTKEVLADITSPLNLALSILQIAGDKFGVEYLSSEGISACLEAADISLKPIAITRALAPAGNKVNRKLLDGETKYKIMTHGRRAIEQLLDFGNICVVFVESGTPRTSRKQLENFLAELTGTIKICDPYYGVRTLDLLEMIPQSCKVQFLTTKSNEKPGHLTTSIRDFITEHPKTEIRVLQGSHDIHDRFILCEQSLLIVGHGLKDIGNKNSFIIRLGKAVIEDLWKKVESDFDTKWQTARPLP